MMKKVHIVFVDYSYTSLRASPVNHNKTVFSWLINETHDSLVGLNILKQHLC